MKLIELTRDRVAIVDDEDFKWLSKWNWHYQRAEERKTGYALRHTGQSTGRQRQVIPMQVAIMKRHKLWKPDTQVDHINTCGCDNQKNNLRLATRSNQKANTGRYRNNTSGITGVGWHKKTSKWQASIRVCRKLKYLGIFVHMEDAIAARRRAEIKYFGGYRHDPKQLCPLWKTGQCPDCAKRAEELELTGA